MSMEPPSQTGRVASAARMESLRVLASKVNIRGRCQGCRKRLEDGEPIVHCGRRKFVCASCSDAKRSLTCRNCRLTITGLFVYRVRYSDKSAVMCADCLDKSTLVRLPSVCRGCLNEIPAGEPLVYCGRLRYICVSCADAKRSTYCKGCHKMVVGSYVYLHTYAGNKRNTVCGQCSIDIENGTRGSKYAIPLEVVT